MQACIALLLLLFINISFSFAKFLPRKRFKPASITKSASYRLPKDLEPITYDLVLAAMVPGYVDIPAEIENTFTAVLKIRFLVKQSTKVIVLNMKELEFPLKPNEYTVKQEKKNQVHYTVVNLVVDVEKEYVSFILDNMLQKGCNYIIEIYYKGVISTERDTGLYSSSYETASGQTRYLASTQMEYVDARSMVPCFDEPEYKAVWKVHIIHPLYTNALSNGQIRDCKQEDTKQLISVIESISNISSYLMTCYEDTPKMSSYLIALVVSDYVSQESHLQTSDNRTVVLRVWAQPRQIRSTDAVLKAGLEAMHNLESLFKIPFPLPKIDMISVPTFRYGAMENWGLIIFSENAFLCDDCVEHDYQHQYIADTAAHELAHQWFGNLVTMKWWNDLFLNEGFADFLQTRVALAVNNDSSHFEAFIKDERELAMNADCGSISRALSADVDDPEHLLSINEYNKGGSVIRMFEKAKGSKNFLLSLQNYLNAHKYGNVDHMDFLKSINMTKEGNGWITQAGYPIVTVKTIDKKHVELSQRSCNPDSKNALWSIPIFYEIEGVEQEVLWLSDTSGIFNVGSSEKLVIDAGLYGYYEVDEIN